MIRARRFTPLASLVLALLVVAGIAGMRARTNVGASMDPWRTGVPAYADPGTDLAPAGIMHMPGFSAAGTARQASAARRDQALDHVLGELPRAIAHAAAQDGVAAACGDPAPAPALVAVAGDAHAVAPASAALAAAASLAQGDDGRRIALPMTMADARLDVLPHPQPVAPRPTEPPPPPTTVPAPTNVPRPTDAPLPTAEPTPGVSGPTWWRDVYPIVKTECTTCHYVGGIGPFPLETFAQAKDMAPAINLVVADHVMPPLPAVPDGETPLDDPRIMTDADRETVLAWIDAGAPEGDPADTPDIEPQTDPFGPPDLSFDIGVDFTPPADQVDEYRCFVIDPGFTEDTEVRMVDLEQTNAAIFHHGILYLGTDGDRGTVSRLERDDPEPGYQCFGGPGFNSQEWVIAEAVGSQRGPYPAGTAKVLPAGSFLVLQLHYNTLNGIGADRTKVHFWLPEAPVRAAPVDVRMANFWFRMPAGDSDYVATTSTTIRNGGGLLGGAPPGDIYQVWGHMHLLGAKISLDLKRADGGTQRLLDIPRWDFNWQGVYDLAEPVRVKTGDEILMTCTWDNSAENQPFVDGRQVTPRPVSWGEGTLDEMCLGGFTVVR